jgi:hypothetical protein
VPPFRLEELLFSTIGTHSDEAIHADGTKNAIVVGAVNESIESLRDRKHVDSRVSIRNQSCVECIPADLLICSERVPIACNLYQRAPDRGNCDFC